MMTEGTFSGPAKEKSSPWTCGECTRGLIKRSALRASASGSGEGDVLELLTLMSHSSQIEELEDVSGHPVSGSAVMTTSAAGVQAEGLVSIASSSAS